MKTKSRVRISDIGKNPGEPLANITGKDLMPLPYPCNDFNHPGTGKLTEDQRNRFETSFDGTIAVAIPKPQSKAEEDELVGRFLTGLKKLFTKENNWTFLQPLTLSMEYCVKCQTCNNACPVYEASGRQEIYKPTYRSEVLRRLYKRYVKGENRFLSSLAGNDVELNWTTIARLAESAYRCTLCRRCTQTCPIGIDNGLIAHEIRKLFSQEMGIAPKELHEKGTVLQLETGASTGMKPNGLMDLIDFMEEDIEERTGRKIHIPVDKKGADILLIHNAGEFLSWLENPAAFAVLFEEVGLSWTLSSELSGYDAVNYGVWYDDVQLARVAYRHTRIAKELGVNKIVIGECGHAHKAAAVVADRVLIGDHNIPRVSCMPLLEEIVFSGKLKLDPQRNNFPVTLHDPCNMVRLMGVVEPQRRILRAICPQFREMAPKGVENYCCGGGSGFAIMTPMNFPDWKLGLGGRMKVKQVLDVFQDVISPDIMKYICSPCSNCKGQFRDLIQYYELEKRCNIHYTGLVEFIVNAMVDTPMKYIEEEVVEEAVPVPVPVTVQSPSQEMSS
jgi:Fe-S oxidoreductase